MTDQQKWVILSRNLLPAYSAIVREISRNTGSTYYEKRIELQTTSHHEIGDPNITVAGSAKDCALVNQEAKANFPQCPHCKWRNHHAAKDCPNKHRTDRCGFCQKIGHAEHNCRQKRRTQRQPPAAGSAGSAANIAVERSLTPATDDDGTYEVGSAFTAIDTSVNYTSVIYCEGSSSLQDWFSGTSGCSGLLLTDAKDTPDAADGSTTELEPAAQPGVSVLGQDCACRQGVQCSNHFAALYVDDDTSSIAANNTLTTAGTASSASSHITSVTSIANSTSRVLGSTASTGTAEDTRSRRATRPRSPKQRAVSMSECVPSSHGAICKTAGAHLPLRLSALLPRND